MERRWRRILPRVAVLALACLVAPDALAATPANEHWLPAEKKGVSIATLPDGTWQVTSDASGEFTLESAQSFPAQSGDTFEIELRIKAGLNMRALPELVCYDANGREIPGPSALARANPFTPTSWQSVRRIYPAQPGTATVRARVRASGKGGLITLADLRFGPREIDPYETGALISQPHPKSRRGVVLESNHGIVNRASIDPADRDHDGKWAYIAIDVDALTAPDQRGEDWRSRFEDNPSVILWSDGAVLKSDSVLTDRAPDRRQALHFRMQVHAGPYTADISDPGRAVAVSLDGETWKRHDAGSEISLGELPMPDGVIEFWIDACYRDPMSAGPAYFDYVRLMPTIDPPSIERLFAVARRKPERVTQGRAEEQSVAVTVDVPAFAGASPWPVRCGLPVPQGELVSTDNVAVLDASGRRLPSQVRPMAEWPDGSIKWLQLDFMHNLSGAGGGNYTVRYGKQVPASPPAELSVHVRSIAGGLEVNTGAIKFLVSNKRFGLLEEVWLASGDVAQREPMAATIVESGGKSWSALDLPVANIEIEQSGPLHTVILVETKLAESGKPSSGFYHRARIHAYAGSPVVHVDYFVANTDSRPAENVGGSMASKVVVESFALKITLPEPIVQAVHARGRVASEGALVQTSAEEALERVGAEEKTIRARIPGWLGLELESGDAFHLGLSGFREQFPKAFRWDRDDVQIDLWAAEGGDFDWIEGVGKTHHLTFVYGAGAASDGALLATGPVLAMASPEWYARSGAFGPVGTADEGPLPAVERTLADHMRNAVIDRVGLGFENYGDHSSGGYIKGTFLWDNNEYDLPAACMVHFARTGDREALRIGLASALHYIDVDTIHYSSERADWARAQHVHSHGLFGHHTAQGPDFHHGGYVQGLIWYSYLTGEPIGILGAQGIADWCLRNLRIHTQGMERALGHPLMTLNDVYEATDDERYLHGAARLVDQALKWENPFRSGFRSPITESPAYYSVSTFNSGLVSAALMKFNGWAGLPEIEAMLERLGRSVLTDTWLPPNRIRGKGGSPRGKGEPRNIASHARLMARLYTSTKDPFYLVAPRVSVEAAFGEDAKKFGTRSTGLVYNYLPWLLAVLGDSGQPASGLEFEAMETGDGIALAPGAAARLTFRVRNTGGEPVQDLRLSLHARQDFAVTPLQSIPSVILPGQSAECTFELRAPVNLNLTSDYNRIVYAQCSLMYRRNGRAEWAHRWTKIVVQ